MGDQDLQLRDELGKTPNLSTKKFIATPFPHLSLDCIAHIGKKTKKDFTKHLAYDAHF